MDSLVLDRYGTAGSGDARLGKDRKERQERLGAVVHGLARRG
jgi:hypothetical protein